MGGNWAIIKHYMRERHKLLDLNTSQIKISPLLGAPNKSIAPFDDLRTREARSSQGQGPQQLPTPSK